MPGRYFNWKLAIVLLIGLVVLGATAFGLRQWRRSTRAERGLVLGNKAYDEHRYEDAVKNWPPYLAVVGDDVPILLKYADAHLNIRPLKRNNLQQAVASYRIVLREDKNNSEAVTKLTELYLVMRTPGEAEWIATKYLKTNQDPELRRMLAVALARQRKFNEAAAELKNIIAEHPEQILAYEILGQLAEQRPEDFPDSPAHLFDEAIKDNPSSPLAYIIRAAFHLRSNDRPKALADLEQAEKLDLSDPIIRLRLAGEFINANVLDKAEKHLEVVQMAEPTSQALWRIWATLALKSNSKATMLKVAETGLKELTSQPWDFMPTVAEFYIRCDELDRAGDCISKLRQKDIAPAAVVFLQGLLADRRGHLFEAIKYFRRAIQLGNKSLQVRLALASTLSRSGDAQSALRQLRTLVSEWPDFLNGRLALARLLAQTGNWAETAEQARIARQISPNSLDATLLHTQARMQLLAARPTGENAQMWQDIEDQLAALEKATDNAFSVKASQLQLAVLRSQFSKAHQLLEEMKNSYPSRIEVAMAEVELLIAQDKNDEAILKLYDAVSAFPESIRPVRYLAILLAAKDKTQECEKIIKDALTRIEQPTVRRELGLLLAGFYNRWNEQEKRYQLLNSLTLDLPNNILVQRELLRCEKVIKDSDRAQQLVKKIKSIEGEDGWQWRYEQAKIWFQQDNFENRYPQIISLLKENLLANPDDQASRMLLAHSYERAGELQLAISTYREAYDRSPQDLRIIDAYVNMWQNKFAEAGELLDKLKIQDPNSLQVAVAQVELNVRQGKSAEAIALCDELINNLNNASVYIFRARTFVSLGESNKAIEDFEHAITIEPNNVETWVARSDFYRSIGQPDKAVADIQQALSLTPSNLQVLKRAISLLLASKSPDRVRQGKSLLYEARKVNPEDIELRLYEARSLLAEGTAPANEEATQILQKITEDQPKISEAWLLLGELSLRRGQYGKAVDIALRGLVHTPNDRQLLLLKARAEAELSPLLAIPTLRGLLERDPNDVDIALLLASTYIEIGETEKPVTLLRKQLDMCDASDRRRYEIALAVALHKNGNKADAQKIFDSLYLSAPDDSALLFAQVGLLKDDKLWSRLNQMVVDWCQNHPEDSRTPITIAVDLAATEDSQAKKEAAKLYEHILKLQPDNVIAINNLAWTLCEEQDKHQQALELARRGLEIAPNYVDLIDTRGVAYYRLGQYEKAVQDFTKCLKLYPKGTPAAAATYFHLGRALDGLGQKDEAIENLNKALELNAEIGGLSTADTEEMQRLLDELSQGN